MLRPLAIAFLVSAAFPALAQELPGETLLVEIPGDFVEGSRADENNILTVEYVPQGESVEDWSRKITTQVIKDSATTAEAMAESIAAGWSGSCSGGAATRLGAGTHNGYPITMWYFLCAENPQTGKAQTMLLKGIEGSDALFVVQYAFRAIPAVAEEAMALEFLQQVAACDSRSTEHPCPTDP